MTREEITKLIENVKKKLYEQPQKIYIYDELKEMLKPLPEIEEKKNEKGKKNG